MKRTDPSFQTHELRSPNLLPEEPKEEPKKVEKPKRRSKTKALSCFFIILILIIIGATTIVARSNSNFFVGVKNGFFVRQLTHIFTGAKNELKGEAEDRINFLLLGIGGPGHDGPYLTDTIILGSFNPKTKEAAMLSIPRDLIVPDGEGEYIKVNHIYALNQKNGIEEAFSVTKRLIGNAFGLDIQYMGVVDFQGFVEMIDTIGGVTVDVEKSFTDYQFPAGPNQYQVVSFETGTQTMDGLTALRYARSRHGNNGEGSDFARSKRQQKIILATKEKITSFNTLINPAKITALFDLVNQYTKTDMEPWEMVRLVQLGKNVNPELVSTTVLDDSPNGYLYSGISSIDGAYILQPRSGNFDELKLLAKGMLENTVYQEEAPNILVQNGTTVPGLALTVDIALDNVGIKPTAIGNANRQNYTSTTLYDYTDGNKPKTRALLESRFNTVAQTNIPIDLLPYTVAKTMELTNEDGTPVNLDFLLILGEDVGSAEPTELIRTLTFEELQGTSTASSTDELFIDEENDDEPGEDDQNNL